ncbi:MAG: hypothetical protein QHH19_06005 [Candidatus Thermoplasmatota archaeon]|jgi:uncharacterized membrane protein|nr:hypothetical protein [Candidatus Thermoplasmatota archaeon]
MTYIILEFKPEDAGKINTITKDDTVSRQSIVIRDSSSIEMKGNNSYLKIEGSEQGIKRAKELAKELGINELDKKKAEEINKKIEQQEDSAATGMGMIFD